MLVERRRHDRDRRESSRVSAVFAVKNVVAGAIELDQAEDIGPTGITLRRPVAQQMAPETPMALSFELPNTREMIAVGGVVVSDRNAGGFRRTGVRFVELDDDKALIIAAYIARHGSYYYPSRMTWVFGRPRPPKRSDTWAATGLG